MSSWETEGNRAKNEGKLVVQMINSSGGYGLKELELNPHYQRLLEVTNTVCNRLRNYRSNKVSDTVTTIHIGDQTYAVKLIFDMLIKLYIRI